MPAALSITESDVMTVLRSFLLGILPDGIEVIQGQDNRVPEPKEDDYVVFWPTARPRLSTNVDTYSTDGTEQNARQATQLNVQIDVHGPASADNAQIISTLLRDDYACEQFAASGFDIQPLYSNDPKQLPFLNGQQQVEDRWSIDAVLQANPVVTVPIQSADALTIGVFNVDVTYPPAGAQ